MLDELTNHFIICGYGRIGSIIADEFRRQQVPFVVIDRDPERVHEVDRARAGWPSRPTPAARRC